MHRCRNWEETSKDGAHVSIKGLQISGTRIANVPHEDDGGTETTENAGSQSGGVAKVATCLDGLTKAINACGGLSGGDRVEDWDKDTQGFVPSSQWGDPGDGAANGKTLCQFEGEATQGKFFHKGRICFLCHFAVRGTKIHIICINQELDTRKGNADCTESEMDGPRKPRSSQRATLVNTTIGGIASTVRGAQIATERDEQRCDLRSKNKGI
jgi:hypothetical protein